MNPLLETAGWKPPLPAHLLAQSALLLDLRGSNPALAGVQVENAQAFGQWIDEQVSAAHCAWALDGYGEDRALYAMSPLFRGDDAPRSVHLGVDFWLPAATPVFAAHAGTVHSLGDNALFGDYGGTVLLEHADIGLYTLYGHLNPHSLAGLVVGQAVAAGEHMAELGTPEHNVGWPPHLHFQLIRDIDDYRGDFPGVCLRDEADVWLARCPDPAPLIKQWCPNIRA